MRADGGVGRRLGRTPRLSTDGGSSGVASLSAGGLPLLNQDLLPSRFTALAEGEGGQPMALADISKMPGRRPSGHLGKLDASVDLAADGAARIGRNTVDRA